MYIKNRTDRSDFTVVKLIRPTVYKSDAIKKYYDLGEYYPIIQDRNHYVAIGKKMEFGTSVTSSNELSGVHETLNHHIVYETIDVIMYDVENAYVITKSDYSVELI